MKVIAYGDCYAQPKLGRMLRKRGVNVLFEGMDGGHHRCGSTKSAP